MNNSMQKQLLQMLSQMNKEDLEHGLKKISSSLSNEDKEKLLKAFNNREEK